MKNFSKEQLETMLRIFAQTGDYDSMLDLLSSHPEIDINSQDTSSKKNALEMLLDGDETDKRNQTILLLVDKYKAEGLSAVKYNELSQGFMEDDEELYFDAQESPRRSNSPFSSIVKEEEERESPKSVAVNMDAELEEVKNSKKQFTINKEAAVRILSPEAQQEYESRGSSRISTPLSSVSADQQEALDVEEEQPKEIERADLIGHEDFTLKHIIEKDLIAKAALQGDLTMASSMVDRVIDSEEQGAETAIKNGFSKMITAFPGVHSQADEPRNAAFIVYNDLKKQFNSIGDMTMSSPEIIAVTNRDDFQRSRKRLPSMALSEDLKRAQGIIREELPAKIEEARGGYEKEKDKVTAITQNFTDAVNLVTDRINLNDYQTPKLDHYSAELKDIVVNAMGKNKQKFAVSKAEAKTATAAKSTKNISDFDAKRNVVRELPALSEPAQGAISSYHAKYSKEKEAQLATASLEDRDRIIEETANKFKVENPEFDKNKFKEEFYELTEDPIYSKACEEVFELQLNSQVSKDSVKFNEGKKQEAQDVIDEIKADLVPMAIRLHQLNDQLESDDRMDSKNLHSYVNAVFVAQLRKHLPDEKLDPSFKNKFSKTIDDPLNREAFKLTEEELQRVDNPKEAMKEILGQMGLKPVILEKSVPTQEQEAVKKLGTVMLGAGMNKDNDGTKRVNPFAAGKLKLEGLSRE